MYVSLQYIWIALFISLKSALATEEELEYDSTAFEEVQDEEDYILTDSPAEVWSHFETPSVVTITEPATTVFVTVTERSLESIAATLDPELNSELTDHEPFPGHEEVKEEPLTITVVSSVVNVITVTDVVVEEEEEGESTFVDAVTTSEAELVFEFEPKTETTVDIPTITPVASSTYASLIAPTVPVISLDSQRVSSLVTATFKSETTKATASSIDKSSLVSYKDHSTESGTVEFLNNSDKVVSRTFGALMLSLLFTVWSIM